MIAPTTSIDPVTGGLKITVTAPLTGGSPINGYKIEI
jgi:hypothetical protein